MFLRIHLNACLCIRVLLHRSLRVYVHTSACVCMSVCTHVYVCVSVGVRFTGVFVVIWCKQYTSRMAGDIIHCRCNCTVASIICLSDVRDADRGFLLLMLASKAIDYKSNQTERAFTQSIITSRCKTTMIIISTSCSIRPS